MNGPVKFIGGRLCLDFVNTVSGRISRQPRPRGRDYADAVLRDKLAGYADLAHWGRLAGAISERELRVLLRAAARHPDAAEAVFARATALRESLYRIFKCTVERWRPAAADAEIVRTETSVARAREVLTASAAGFTWEWDSAATALDRVLWPIAKSAAGLLTSSELASVRQCGGLECGWIFLDASRNRKRHWCDMRECGNRAKIARFRQRRAMG